MELSIPVNQTGYQINTQNCLCSFKNVDFILFCNGWWHISNTVKSPNIWTFINYGNNRSSENHMAVGEHGLNCSWCQKCDRYLQCTAWVTRSQNTGRAQDYQNIWRGRDSLLFPLAKKECLACITLPSSEGTQHLFK